MKWKWVPPFPFFGRARLSEIDEDFEGFEVEDLVLYGNVEERLMKAGLVYDMAHEPPCIPPEQV
jgi:hypothetical protein